MEPIHDVTEFLMRTAALVCLLFTAAPALSNSICFGTTSAGRLENACKLPASGDNYSNYSSVLRMAGRTYVHCDVSKVMTNAYKALAESHPDTVFVYAETGKKKGGKFKPHKTHQNGLSVDFMVPVVNAKGESVPLPTSALNKYGYDINFTLEGRYKKLSIDYEAFAAHLAALKQAAANQNVGIWRVIFDPKMQHELKNTKAWPKISDLTFSQKRSWVRHDEHYHVDFVIPCEPL